MKISLEDVILIKNLYLSKQYGARRVLSELPDKGWHRQSAEEKPQDGYNCPASRERKTVFVAYTVKNLVLSQEDKPKRHRSAR